MPRREEDMGKAVVRERRIVPVKTRAVKPGGTRL